MAGVPSNPMTGGGAPNFMDWLLSMLPEQLAATGVAPPTGPTPAPQAPMMGAPPPPIPGTSTPALAAPPIPGAPILPNISQFDLMTQPQNPAATNPSGTSTAWMGAGAPGGPSSPTPGAATPPTADPLMQAMDSLAQVKAPTGPEVIRPSTPSLPQPKQIDLSPLLALMTQLDGGRGGGAKATQLPFLTNFLGTAPQR